MLAWTIYLSFAGALIEALLPKGKPALARWFALATAVAGLVLAAFGFAQGAGHGRMVIVDVPWVPSMGVRYTLAADGISLVLVLLTGLAAISGVSFGSKLIATTLRTAHTASRNAWGAIALYQDEIVHIPQRDIDILDRVGGGDSFASGLIYGMIAGKPVEWAVRCGVAHGALAMTTAGDTSMSTLAEVERAMKGGSARIAR